MYIGSPFSNLNYCRRIRSSSTEFYSLSLSLQADWIMKHLQQTLSAMGIYKRKQKLDQESDRENKRKRKKTRSRPRKRPRKYKKNFLFSWSLSWSSSCFLTFLFSFINSHLRMRVDQNNNQVHDSRMISMRCNFFYPHLNRRSEGLSCLRLCVRWNNFSH